MGRKKTKKRTLHPKKKHENIPLPERPFFENYVVGEVHSPADKSRFFVDEVIPTLTEQASKEYVIGIVRELLLEKESQNKTEIPKGIHPKGLIHSIKEIVNTANTFGLVPSITLIEQYSPKTGQTRLKYKTRVIIDIPTAYGIHSIDMGEVDMNTNNFGALILLGIPRGAETEPSEYALSQLERFTKKKYKRGLKRYPKIKYKYYLREIRED